MTRTTSPLATCILCRIGAVLRCSRRDFLYTSGFISDHLRRQRHDLHEPLLAQLAADRAEDAGGAGLAFVVDQHRRVLVEAHVAAVLARRLLGRPHDDRLDHLAAFHLAGRDRVVDRAHHELAPPPDAEALSFKIVCMRAISRRIERSWSGLVSDSVARRNSRRNRSSVSTASFCCSSSVLSPRSSSGRLAAGILPLLPLHKL